MSKLPSRGTKFWRVMAYGATLVVLAGTLVPAEHVPALRVFQWDKLLHVVSFGGLTVLWRYASVSPRVTVLLMGLLALGTELAQRWMRVGRQWDVRDLAADGIGIALGLLVAWGTFRVFGARTEAASISEG